MVVGKEQCSRRFISCLNVNTMKLKTFIAMAVIALFTACSTTYRATDTGDVISVEATKAFGDQYPTATNVT